MFHVKLVVTLMLFTCPIFAQKMGSTTLEVKKLPEFNEDDLMVKNFIAETSKDKALDSLQTTWFYWINYSRVNPKRFWDSIVMPILAMYPSFRNTYTESLQRDLSSTSSLPLIKPNNTLKKTAQKFATELAVSKSSPTHTSSSGETFTDRMKGINIQGCAGENITLGSNNTVLMLVLLYIDQGVPEVGHRKTLLNPSFTEMGLGISSYSQNQLLVVQDLACAQN